MYFDVKALGHMATQYYFPDESVATLSISTDPALGEAHVLQEPGQTIRIAIVGSGRLYFHTHAWSGRATILNGAKISEVDLFSKQPGELWVPFEAVNQSRELIVVNTSAIEGGSSKGHQVWLRGIELESLLPWLPQVQPISPVADLAHGFVGPFLVPHNDSVIGMNIKNVGVWAKKDLDFFESEVKSGDVVFDIGANIGHHSVFFSKLVGNDGRVLIFEPQKSMFNFACGNLAINDCHNVEAFQGALGEATSVVRMGEVSYTQVNNFGALGISFDSASNEGEPVKVWSLDELIAGGLISVDRIDFLKIDVQSFELYVLKGAIQTIARFKPRIFIEISPHWMRVRGYEYTEVYNLLRSQGYQFHHFHEGDGLDGDVRTWSGNVGEEWDVFCFPVQS